MAFLLGVDTGGTYTDAVVYDDEANKVLGAAKALTTHRSLDVGIGEAASAALAAAKFPARSPRKLRAWQTVRGPGYSNVLQVGPACERE